MLFLYKYNGSSSNDSLSGTNIQWQTETNNKKTDGSLFFILRAK